MEQRRLGTSGLKVSAIGLGCNNFGMRISIEETQTVVDAALDNGITFFDTADVYGGTKSEEFLGAALKGKRDKAVVATKFAMGENAGGSRRYIVSAVEASLKRLGTDRIDLYQMHRPDPETPIDETLRALDDLVRDGKVLYLGNSNFSGWQIADADWTSKTQGLERFVSAQNNYSLLERNVEREVLPACEQFGLGFLPFFPLASGLLSGKYSRGEAPPEGTRLAAWGPRGAAALERQELRQDREVGGLGAGQRPHHPGTRLRLDPGSPRGQLGDRRRHQGRPDRRQRQGRRLEADAGAGRGSHQAGEQGLTNFGHPGRPTGRSGMTLVT
jgi:aryl-alcohol dehydrogenase-like predicted oxidoreductase